MTSKVVKTQSDLDTALADSDVDTIDIRSSGGVWLYLRASGSATVRASGSATVHAYGSATVHASGSATVHAYGSATVHASGSATVRAYGSATVHASGSATVRASDSATVHAYGSATVRASGSATVRAYGSATVHASDSATVRATPHVAVHLHNTRVTVTGGVVIDVAALDLTDPHVWARHHGVQVDGDTAMLYKAVDADLTAGVGYDKPTRYAVGTVVTADDWRDDRRCGGGLHISPHAWQAKRYRDEEDGTRYLRVSTPVAGLRPIDGDKAKTRQVKVLAEVDIDGNDLPVAAVLGAGR